MSYSYDKNKLNSLTKEECEEYKKIYDKPNIRKIRNPITNKDLKKNGVIAKEIYNWCNENVLKSKSKSSSEEIILSKEDFLDLLFEEKKIKDIKNNTLKPQNVFVYNKILEKEENKKLMDMITACLYILLDDEVLYPILNTKTEIKKILNTLNEREMYHKLVMEVMSGLIKRSLLIEGTHKIDEKIENMFWAAKYILFMYNKNKINLLKREFRSLIDYVNQIIDTGDLFYINDPLNRPPSFSVSSSPISGNKRWIEKNEEKRLELLANLEKKCIDMHDPVTFENFNDYPLEKLEQVMEIGKPNIDGKYNCFYTKTLYKLYQQAVNDNKSPINPMNREKLTKEELDEILNKLKKIYPNIAKPLKKKKYHKNILVRYYIQIHQELEYNVYVIIYKYYLNEIYYVEIPLRYIMIPVDEKLIEEYDDKNLSSEGIPDIELVNIKFRNEITEGKIITKKFPFKLKYPELANNHEDYLENKKFSWEKYKRYGNMILNN